MKFVLSYLMLVISRVLTAAPMYEINPSYDFIPSLWGLGNDIAENGEKSLSKAEWIYDNLNELERIIDTEINWNEQVLITYSRETKKRL